MKNCIIVGNPNVGKTSFFIALIQYLGINHCEMTVEDIYGHIKTKRISMYSAKKYLVSIDPFKTKDICKIQLDFPVYKGYERLTLIDTAGITDGINKIEEIRKSMAHTLRELSQAKIILHILDTERVFRKKESGISEIDYQINEFGTQQGCYCILANKIDKLQSKKGLEIIQNTFKENYIIPISTINMTGFKEVKAFVSRNL